MTLNCSPLYTHTYIDTTYTKTHPRDFIFYRHDENNNNIVYYYYYNPHRSKNSIKKINKT